jgi:uncharacterized protein (TIGR03067 family)
MGMQALVMVAASLGGVVDRPVPKKDAPKEEQKKLEGEWRAVILETRGRQLSEESVRLRDVRLVIQGDEYKLSMRGRIPKTMHFKVDPTSNPKTIDLVINDGFGKPQTTYYGIYVLEGDTLKICQSRPAGKRPTEFSTKGTERHVIYVFKRVKP